MNGVLVIDKPAGLTSHDVVNRVRRILHQRAVGHLGTLDPLATGVLPLVTGNLTRLAQFYAASEKTYQGVIRFGFATDTYDAEGEPAGPAQIVKVSLEQLRELAAPFCGLIEQMPPPFSAKKIHGVPAYKLARTHKDVPLKPIRVEIKEFEILGVEGDRASFRARVASGTYMRSVAHDLGQQLGCGAHLESLRRTSLGEFDLTEAHSLEEVDAAAKIAQVEEMFIHPRKLLPQLPSVTANEEMASRIRSGRTVNLPELSRAKQVKVFCGQRELIAIATRIAGTLFHPKIVLAADASAQLANGQRK
ncbi:MAG: tRNA pseudouridine(55) synthase TruB [Acidobacteria bacterium 13_1_40CM_4_58_4]|nr:MAG: tRNA pseudouridine(55) synthase TruB [Acidobacteria bacterium 13_1_40CM_4_58_4]